MWREILVSASCLTAIILAIVGVAKMPFKRLKEKHKGWYRAIFFVLSLALVIGCSIITELYIVGGVLLSVEFACLILGTAFGVFGGYAAYENLPIKTLVHKGATAFMRLMNKYSDSKVEKFIGKVGMDKIQEIAERSEPVEPEVIEPSAEQVLIEEKKEGE